MMLLGSLIPPILFVLARQYVEPLAALLAASIAVVYPSLVIFSASFMSETVFNLLLLLTLLCWTRFSNLVRGGWNLIIWGGIFMGLTLLTRTNVVPVFVLWLLFLLIDGGKERWRHLLRYSVFLLMAILVILPWCLRNYNLFGEWSWIATNSGMHIWQRYNLLPPDGTMDSRKDIQEKFHRIYTITKKRIDSGEDPVDVLRPYLAQTVRGYLLRLGPEEERYIRSFDGLNEFQVDRRLIAESLTSMVRFPTRTAVRIIENTIKYWDPHHDPDLIHRYRSYNLAYGIMAPFMVW